MPNIITHGLFAKAVYDEISDQKLKEIIKEFPREYIIGSNGPDFLFFYKFFQKKYAPVRELGSKVHAGHVNEFYDLAFDLIQNEKDATLQKAMISYVAGHLCHWALDSRAHPYIFYKTGSYSGLSASMHHRFESMMDAMMLMKIRHETIKTFKFYLLAKQSPYSVQAVAAIYVPIIETVFHEKITAKEIKDALDDWYSLQNWLYDPKGVKTRLLKAYEKKAGRPWLFSGNVVPYKIDKTYDILNEKKEVWCHSTDETKISHESFMEIFERAKKDVLNIFEHHSEKEFVLSQIGNASYDTQESEPKEMKHFNLIYGDMYENL